MPLSSDGLEKLRGDLDDALKALRDGHLGGTEAYKAVLLVI
jgi:hypothetical protein